MLSEVRVPRSEMISDHGLPTTGHGLRATDYGSSPSRPSGPFTPSDHFQIQRMDDLRYANAMTFLLVKSWGTTPMSVLGVTRMP